VKPDLLQHLQTALAGAYTFERELGRGAMATIHAARNQAGEPIAFKVLNPELGPTVGAERFRREIRIAGRLQHPNILGILDSGVTSVPAGAGGRQIELLWFTMPLVRGQNVWERFEKEGPCEPDEVRRIASAVLLALAYAHAQGVVHRDIKPDNILLEDSRVLVGDFGLARAVSEVQDKLTATGTVVGTPDYMSPEQVSGDREIDGRSDIFSLGCVLYELLSGAPPFGGATPQVAMMRRLAGPPAPRLRPVVPMPEHMEVAVLRALAREPAERFRSAEEFAAALNGRTSNEVPKDSHS